MRAFRGFKIWVATLLVATASWAQVLNMDGLKSQIATFNAGSANVTINIGADFSITSPLEINNNGYTLTLQSSTDTPRQLTRATTGNLFTIKKGSLTLQNITIDGSNANAPYQTNARGSLVFVGDGGTLNMKDGATLQNNTIRDDNGSGVYVDSRGTFNMSGGKITGNKTNLSGGGVYIYALRATFNMSGGIISGNSCGTSATSYSGGVHFANTPLTTDTDPNKTASVFRLGGTAVIKDNTKGNGSPSNVYMAGSRYITLGDGTVGVPPPTDGMEVWITKVAEHGLFVKEGANPPNPPDDPFGDTKYFEADAGSQVYYIDPGQLAMEAGYDISLSTYSLALEEVFDYTTQPEREIMVTNIGGRIGKLTIYLSGIDADNFELDLTRISDAGMNQNEIQKFTVKPKLGLSVGTYSAIVLVVAPQDIDGGPVIMRRLDIDFTVKEYVEDRTLYFNQSDGNFYASNIYTEIDSLPAHEIFSTDNQIPIPTSWNPETNTLQIYGFAWTTTAPYALYFSQPTPVTLELVGENTFVSNRTTDLKDYSAGIVSRSSLTITGDGNLKAQGGKANTESYGVFSKALTINSGTLTASGDATAMKIEKDVVLRIPANYASRYEWWYINESTKGSGAFNYNSNYKWIKIKVPPPDYEVEASADNNGPLINAEIEITLTVKDITTGNTYASFGGSHLIDLTGVVPEDFGITSPISVQFDSGIGKFKLTPKNPGSQILWFNMESPNYPAINPVVITPVSPIVPVTPPVTPPFIPTELLPSISLHPGSPYTFSATYGYSQASMNVIVGNDGDRPTGEITVKISGKDSDNFILSSDKVATIAVGGSAAFRLTPILGLKAKTYTVTVTINGNGIAGKKELVVNFKVNPVNCVPFKDVAISLWDNNTLTVINNPSNNSTHLKFYEFAWFKDGQEIGIGQSLSQYQDGRPLQPGKYYVEMTNEKDGRFVSCEYEVPEPPIVRKISSVDFSDVETVDVYSVSGKHLARLNVHGSFHTEIRSIKNAYILVLKNKTGTKKAIRAAEVLR
ncbi:MAG: right-handed parallel beta-helix repeat-containing protein [Fibromonadaceae bacterium]|jgi:hypothetical protein|nr:right-handed parallel beta-helix repeat-containing protein [Fibromonadaceae bacterium]